MCVACPYHEAKQDNYSSHLVSGLAIWPRTSATMLTTQRPGTTCFGSRPMGFGSLCQVLTCGNPKALSIRSHGGISPFTQIAYPNIHLPRLPLVGSQSERLKPSCVCRIARTHTHKHTNTNTNTNTHTHTHTQDTGHRTQDTGHRTQDTGHRTHTHRTHTHTRTRARHPFKIRQTDKRRKLGPEESSCNCSSRFFLSANCLPGMQFGGLIESVLLGSLLHRGLSTVALSPLSLN